MYRVAIGRRLAVAVSIFYVVCLTFLLPASAEAARKAFGGVIDHAHVFNAEERQALDVLAGRIARRMDGDFFVVSVDDNAPRWVQLESHRHMLDRVTREVREAATRHFGGPKELTALLVFRNFIVLHLETDSAPLAQRLLYSHFYSGVRGAWDRIRRPEERHFDTTLRYLEGFVALLPERGAPSPITDLGVAYFQQKALLASREIVASGWSAEACRLAVAAVTSLAAFAPWPGWLSFLLAVVLPYLAITIIRPLLVLPGKRAFELVKRVLQPLGIGALLAPLFAVAFAIGHGDLENIAYIHQTYGGAVTTYLDWAEELEGRSPRLPIELMAGAALLVAGLAFWSQLGALTAGMAPLAPDAGAAASTLRVARLAGITLRAGFGTLVQLCWTLSFYLWPGLIALLLLACDLASRLIDVAIALRRQRFVPRPPPPSFPSYGTSGVRA